MILSKQTSFFKPKKNNKKQKKTPENKIILADLHTWYSPYNNMNEFHCFSG